MLQPQAIATAAPEPFGSMQHSATARISALVAFVFASTGVAHCAEVNYPSRPVSVVVPFAAGGSAHAEARLYIDKVQASLGQPFVFDFKGGAGGTLGARHALRAKPDGYTILIINTGLTVFPNFYPDLDQEAVGQLVPVTELSDRTTAIIVSVGALPKVRSLKELEAYAQATPGQLACNTAGAGGITHIVCAALANAIGSPILPVHYKGIAQGQIDLIAGRTQVSGGTLLAALGQIKAGKLRAIATLGPTRSALAPDLPTGIEQGYEIHYPSWLGVFLPPNTPQPIVDKLHAAFVKAVKSPDVVEALTKLGTQPVASAPAEFRKKIQGELVYWKKIIEANRITLE